MDDRLALAVKYYQSDLVEQAATLVAEILADPEPPREALSLAATLAFEQQDYQAAVGHCDQLLDDFPEDGHALLLKGRALSDLGQQEAALACLEKAVAVAPDLAAAHYNLGWVLSRAGDAAGAITAYRTAVRHQEDYPVAWNNLGLLLERTGDGEAAVTAFRKAIDQFPGFSAAHNNLGAVLAAGGRYGEAEASYRAAVEADSDNVDAMTNLGVARLERADIAGAIAVFDDVLAKHPDHAAALDNRLYAEIYRRDDDDALRADHTAVGGAPSKAEAGSPQADSPPARALRVGFVSPDFRRHSVSFFALPLIQALDRSRCITILFGDVADPDTVTAQYEAAAAEWYNIAGLSDENVSRTLTDARLDVVVDLAGRTTGNRLRALAGRVAPVQVTALGYPGPTGEPAMDYWLCDGITNPPATGEMFDRDRPLRLDRGLHVFAPPSEGPAVGPLPAKRQGFVTFGSFNKLAKVSEDTITLWSAVLAAIPNARLLLKARALADSEIAAEIKQRLQAGGVAEDRIETRGWAADDRDHLSLYAQVDIALDTFPYNGTTTTCEALWMGVPVLTLKGRGHAARVGASLLASCGLSDWVAETPQVFQSLAEARVADIAALSNLRETLRERVANSALTDAAAAARAFERALQEAWMVLSSGAG